MPAQLPLYHLDDPGMLLEMAPDPKSSDLIQDCITPSKIEEDELLMLSCGSGARHWLLC